MMCMFNLLYLGEVLREYLGEMIVMEVVMCLGVVCVMLQCIVNGVVGILLDMVYCLVVVFGISFEFWVGM